LAELPGVSDRTPPTASNARRPATRSTALQRYVTFS
jgi:hypothetical protein